MAHRRLVFAWITLVLPSALAAQPIPGDRLRIGFIHGGEVVGMFEEATPAALVIYRGGIPIAVPRAQIGELERSLGAHGDFGRNFLVSIVASALLVGGVAALSTDPSESCDMFCGRRAAFAFGAVGGAIVGIPIGIVTGIASFEERWERVPVPPASDVTLGIGPSGGGAVGLSLRIPAAFP